MKDRLRELLETLGYPVYLQGSMGDDEEYPADFITFWTADSEDVAHFDNESHATSWLFYVYFYSSNPANVASVPDTIRSTLKAAGFIPDGRGHDIMSDEPTHTGWIQEFYCLEV